MCEEHNLTNLTRRGIVGMAVGAGVLLSSARATFAAGPTPTTLCVMCIDHRFVVDGVDYFRRETAPEIEDFDLIAMAGASLAGEQTSRFPNEAPGFWEQVAAARALHPNINKVIVLDHLTCGAYKEAFPNMPDERAKHQEVADRVWKKFTAQNLGSDFFILDDKTRQITRLWPLVK